MRTRLGWHGRLAAATAVAATLAVAAPAGAATTVKLAGGTTTLKLDRRVPRTLAAAGIRIAPVKPAKATRATTLKLPISGGSIDPAPAKGTIDHKGGLALKMGRTKVVLKALSLNTAKGTLSAKAGRARIAFGKVSKKAKVTRRGFATNAAGYKLTLSRKGAGALNAVFGVRAFKKGAKLGTLAVAAKPAEIALTSGSSTVQFNAQTLGGLQQLRATVSVTAPATGDPVNGFRFPVTGETLNLRTLAGSITHSGGLALGPLALSDLEVKLGPAPALAVNLGTIGTLDLTNATRSVDARTRTITLSGAGVKLNSLAATALNQAFGANVFAEGAEIATISTTAQAR